MASGEDDGQSGQWFWASGAPFWASCVVASARVGGPRLYVGSGVGSDRNGVFGLSKAISRVSGLRLVCTEDQLGIRFGPLTIVYRQPVFGPLDVYAIAWLVELGKAGLIYLVVGFQP